MGLVHEEDKVLREVIEQRHRRAAGGAAGDYAAVILDAGAVAELLYHLDVEVRALLYALGLEVLVLALEKRHALVALAAYLLHRALELLLGRDIVAGREDGDVRQAADDLAGDGVYLAHAVYLVAEELDANGAVLVIRGPDLHSVAPDADHVALEGDVVALIAYLDEALYHLVARYLQPHADGDHHLFKVLRLAQAVYAAHGRDDDDVPPLQQRGRGREAQAVDLLVGGGVLLDVGVGRGDVGLGLVVVVVGYEILHGVVREELTELAAKLGREGLVVRQDERGPLHALYDLGHGVGLAGTGDAEQRLLGYPLLQTPGQRVNGLRLISGWHILADNMKIRHGFSFFAQTYSGYFTTSAPALKSPGGYFCPFRRRRLAIWKRCANISLHYVFWEGEFG